MVVLQRLPSIAWLLAVHLGLNSCHGGTPGPGFEDIPARGVILRARTHDSSELKSSINGQAPLAVAAIMGANYGPGGHEHALGGGYVISKAELNFGDGSSWVDVTQDMNTLWWNPAAPSPYDTDWMTQHTYTEAGEFTISGRMTYWDGEVHYAGLEWEVRVTVLP